MLLYRKWENKITLHQNSYVTSTVLTVKRERVYLNESAVPQSTLQGIVTKLILIDRSVFSKADCTSLSAFSSIIRKTSAKYNYIYWVYNLIKLYTI